METSEKKMKSQGSPRKRSFVWAQRINNRRNSHKLKVESNSFQIGVDNHTYICITNNFNQLLGQLITIKNRVVEVYLGLIKSGVKENPGLIFDPNKTKVWQYFQIQISAITGMNQNVLITSVPKNQVLDMWLCKWDVQL